MRRSASVNMLKLKEQWVLMIRLMDDRCRCTSFFCCIYLLIQPCMHPVFPFFELRLWNRCLVTPVMAVLHMLGSRTSADLGKAPCVASMVCCTNAPIPRAEMPILISLLITCCTVITTFLEFRDRILQQNSAMIW